MTPSIYKQLCEEEKRLGEELTDLRNYLSKYHKTFGEVVAPIPQVQTSLSYVKPAHTSADHEIKTEYLEKLEKRGYKAKASYEEAL